MSEFPCKFCGIIVEWNYDEYNSKLRLQEIGGKQWHECQKKKIEKPVEPKEIPLNWFCMECFVTVDIENHPCLHYQTLKKDERSMVRYGISMSKSKHQTSSNSRVPTCGICNVKLKNMNFEQQEKHLERCKIKRQSKINIV